MKERVLLTIAEALAFIAIFFSEIQSALLAIGFLIMMDTFTGIWGSWKTKGRKSIHSSKIGRIISKLILYPTAIIVAKVAQTYLSPVIPWVDVTAGILAIIEVKSIFENISIILGFDLWDRVRKALWKDKTE